MIDGVGNIATMTITIPVMNNHTLHIKTTTIIESVESMCEIVLV